MQQSWKIFTRDLKRLWKVPKVWIIVIGVLIIPAMYAWINIGAFWDPYGNTQNIKVAVVNEDQGANNELTGSINIGDQVVDTLAGNDQLGWQFMDKDEADHALRRGDVYATIEIPSDFSGNLVSMFEGTFTQPTLNYYPNEKLSAVAPVITDTGANSIDTQITSVFKEQVAEATATALRDAGVGLEERIDDAENRAGASLGNTADTLASAQEEITRVQGSLEGARPVLSETEDAFGSVDTTLDDVRTGLSEVQTLMEEVQGLVVNFSDATTSAFVDGTAGLAEGTASANASISTVAGELELAGARLDTATRDTAAVLDEGDTAIAELQGLLDTANLSPELTQSLEEAISGIQQRNATNQELLTDLNGLNNDVGGMVDSVQGSADALAQATQATNGTAQDLRTAVSDTVPALNNSIAQLSSTAGAFSSSISNQQTLLGEASQLLRDIDGQLVATGDTLEGFKTDLANMEDGARTARTDVLALNAAANSDLLQTVTDLDSVGISQYMATPVEVTSETVFPVANYGSGMAGLFTNLSLWIGAFMLMVIYRVEVDTKGLSKNVSVAQAYIGRFLLLALMVICQALVVSVGNLIIGVQTVNPLAFVLTSVFIGLTYLSIIYSLVAAFGHVGRGLAVLLVIVQIPGASGLYPIELMPDFFRAIYPWLPFSYGIDALRETIGGFYGNHYWRYLSVLAVMFVVSFILGIILRRNLSYFNLLFNRQLASTKLLSSEKPQIVGSGYRLADVIHALQNRDEYRADIDRKWKPIRENYSTLLKIAVIVGLIGALVLAAVAWFFPAEKAMMLGISVLWGLVVLGFIGTLEYVKQSFAHAEGLVHLNASELRSAVAPENQGLHTVDVDAGADQESDTEATRS
ncbi:YhgE/Pip domain-containing protein [Corynebacterium lubricantis]|uniref:YhgE/Pip domain-containing protein n=1 Tax=Corynebacterium lubricantis TaxID=541095 RepID=UPI00037ED74A|nr:YhgE/Pip domain-containing protein [Corynebacterium lubricantis]